MLSGNTGNKHRKFREFGFVVEVLVIIQYSVLDVRSGYTGNVVV